MSEYKCAIIGASGARANGHAEAYRHVQRGRLVAASARRAGKLDAFADRFTVPARYTDYREMVENERPDLVHVNAPPQARLEIVADLDAAGVPTVIVEKPVAVGSDDARQWRELAHRIKTKVAVNHQLHFHAANQHLREAIAAGEIGEVRHLDASCRLNLAAQGTHLLQLIAGFSGHRPVEKVQATASGAAGLRPDNGAHVAPDECRAELTFADATTASLHAGPGAPVVAEDRPEPFHKQVHVEGSRGRAHWCMWSWSLVDRHGRTRDGEHDYFVEDALAQARLTESMFDWIENDRHVHPLSLATAMDEFDTILGIYASVLKGMPVSLPMEPESSLLERLRASLDASP